MWPVAAILRSTTQGLPLLVEVLTANTLKVTFFLNLSEQNYWKDISLFLHFTNSETYLFKIDTSR